MTPTEEADLMQAVAREFLGAPPIKVELDPMIALQFMGTLRLALRHPDFRRSDTAAVMRGFAVSLGNRLSLLGPATARVVELGWKNEEANENLARHDRT